jgi:hypothetical protein
MTTLEWLPAAVRDSHPRSFPWAERTDPKGCLHSTEGSSWPTYDGWTIMPHATIMPTPGKGVTVRQHLPFSQASFALRHTRPQPTNGDYVFQFELVGTCDPAGPRGAYYWPDADDHVLADLYRKVIKPLDAAYVIPFRAVRPFLRYPDRAGSNRLTDAEFDTARGWLGHQHVPQNDHGDPGAFPWDRLMTLAHTIDQEDKNVALTDDDIIKVAQAVWHSDKVYIKSGWSGGDQSPAWHLNATSRYAIEGGFDGNRPAGNSKPGTPTRALDLAQAVEDIQNRLTDLADAVAALAAKEPPAAA